MFVLIVRMAMMVGMGVHDAPVHMSMCVGEVGSKKQALIREDLCWWAFGNYGAGFKHQDTICNVLDDVELMGGRNHGLRRPFPLLNEIDELTLASWVERCGRFIEQQNFGIKDENRG